MFAGKVSVRFRTDDAGELIRKMVDEVIHLLPDAQGFLDQLTLIFQSAKEVYLSRFSENRADTEKYDQSAFTHVTSFLNGLINGSPHIRPYMLSRSSSRNMIAAVVS
jgi:hypothetical protein